MLCVSEHGSSGNENVCYACKACKYEAKAENKQKSQAGKVYVCGEGNICLMLIRRT